jgi:hypothetical protein
MFFAIDRITKYANNDRLSLEKTMHKPVPQHLNNTGQLKRKNVHEILLFDVY